MDAPVGTERLDFKKRQDKLESYRFKTLFYLGKVQLKARIRLSEWMNLC